MVIFLTYYRINRSFSNNVSIISFIFLQLTLYDGKLRTSFGFCRYGTYMMFVTIDVTLSVSCVLSQPMDKTISIFHVCMVWIGKSVTRVTDRHHEVCRVMPNSDPE